MCTIVYIPLFKFLQPPRRYLCGALVDDDNSLAAVLAGVDGQQRLTCFLEAEAVLPAGDLTLRNQRRHDIVESGQGSRRGARAERETMHSQAALEDLLEVLYQRGIGE